MTAAPREPAPGLVERAVELLAKGLDLLGLNGTRLRWKWRQRQRDLGETTLRTAILWRSATSPHKMCPACRALVPRAAASCPECAQPLARVRAPGLGRLISNLIPGVTAATSLLLLVNGALFALMLMTTIASGRGRGLLAPFDPITLVRFGSGLNLLTVAYGEWWRIVTPIFLHGGLLHFGFNCYALLQIGPLVEEEYGTERFAVVYLLSGILGNVFSQLLRHSQVHTVGASGALCGLIGLLIVHGARRSGAAGTRLRSEMVQYAVYLFVFSLLPGIDLLCHLGGFLAGLALGLIVPAGPLHSRRAATLWEGLLLVLVLVVLYSFYRVAVDAT